MRERPILFSGPMVRAILAGTKTQTRRAMRPQPSLTPEVDSEAGIAEFYTGDELAGSVRCPYGKVGDRLWVKETIRKTADSPGGYATSEYVADGSPTVADAWPWQRPTLVSIHCPRGLSRILLEVTGLRTERLKACSASDAEAEGAIDWSMECASRVGAGPLTAYRALWESINGAGSWDSNPWVWVVEFERVTP